MSRSEADKLERATRFPRVSGDEPFMKITTDQLVAFSPRERG